MKMSLTNKGRENLLGYLFISPWIIGFLLFGAFPIIYSFFLSLNDVTITASGIETSYVALRNYQLAFTTDVGVVEAFIDFFKNDLLMVFIINVFAVLFAVLLNGKIKGRGIFRTIFFLPVIVVSGPVMAELVSKEVITMPNINDLSMIVILGRTFGENFSTIISNVFSKLIYMFWFSGVQLIVYLTMLQKLDKSMYEAASMDGCSKWEAFWKITLPSIKPIILVNLVYTLILLATFDDNSIISIVKARMFDTGRGFGYAASISWVYFLALMIIIVILLMVFFLRKKKFTLPVYNKEAYYYDRTRYEFKHTFFNTNKKGVQIKKKVLGKNSDGILQKCFIYLILGVMAFAFVYPFIYMFLKSMQTADDVLNPSVGLIPTTLYFENFSKAFTVLGFFNAFKESTIISLVPTIFQIISCSLVGYGLARFDFKFKKIVIVLILISFVIPPQILMIPTYVMYSKMNLLGSIFTFVIPAFLGQGLRSTIFIFLFYQFFRMIPKDYDEAAMIDGASKFQIFTKIIIPLTVPVFVVGFIFSFVWYWNETYLTSLYMPNATTLPLQLSRFADSFRKIYETVGNTTSNYSDQLNEAVYMAGTLISIIPLLIIYFVLQRWFVEGIDRSGITGM